MYNAVRSLMPVPTVIMNRGVADDIAQVGKVASSQDRHVQAHRLSFLTVLPFLLLGACAETQSPTTTAAAPSPVSSPAPTPSCNAPPGSHADKRNPATAWQRAVDGMRAEDCFQALDPQLAPIRREYVGNPRQEAMDKKTLDLAPLGLSARAIQGGEFQHRLPMPD
ncbi:MAG: hypothetical protein INF79_08030 [Roseomonas sp.]|nr:hypothetical protein [Roseomonas sp.]